MTVREMVEFRKRYGMVQDITLDDVTTLTVASFDRANGICDLLESHGYTINADLSINYSQELQRIKDINFGRYFIYYNSFKNLSQSGQFRALNVRVQYRDMYGEEEVGYVIP